MNRLLFVLLFAVATSHTQEMQSCCPPPDLCPTSGSVPEMQRCEHDRFQKADQELKNKYQALMNDSDLDTAHKVLLRQTERAWLSFRTHECTYEASMSGGYLYGLIFTSCETDLTRIRISQVLSPGAFVRAGHFKGNALESARPITITIDTPKPESHVTRIVAINGKVVGASTPLSSVTVRLYDDIGGAAWDGQKFISDTTENAPQTLLKAQVKGQQWSLPGKFPSRSEIKKHCQLNIDVLGVSTSGEQPSTSTWVVIKGAPPSTCD